MTREQIKQIDSRSAIEIQKEKQMATMGSKPTPKTTGSLFERTKSLIGIGEGSKFQPTLANVIIDKENNEDEDIDYSPEESKVQEHNISSAHVIIDDDDVDEQYGQEDDDGDIIYNH